METRKHISPDFKREAVQLLESGSRSGSEIARELGIARNQLYKCQTELRSRGAGVFPGHRDSSGAYHRNRTVEAGTGPCHGGTRHFKKSGGVSHQGEGSFCLFVSVLARAPEYPFTALNFTHSPFGPICFLASLIFASAIA